jgi:hypothetical protein
MSVLYLALGIYVAVVALVLYIRPASMFHPENGSWKEFGIDVGRSNTVFPFWMFAIIWAFVSYAIATLLHVGFAQAAMNSSPSSPMFYEQSVAMPVSAAYMPSNNNVGTPSPFAQSTLNASSSGNSFLPTSMHVNTPMPTFVSPVSNSVSNSMSNGSVPQLPGYYFVDPQASGLPRYVYFGSEPPTFNDLVARSR